MQIITRSFYVLSVFLCLLLPPITATAAPPACNTATEGTIVYNVAHKLVQFCNGTQWIGLTAKIGGGDDTLSSLSCASGQIAKWNGTAWACAADASGMSGLPALASASIWVGNGSNAATAVAMSGDATLSNAGVLTIGANAIGSAEIADGTIANADLAGSIALAKLAVTGTANSSVFLRGDGTWAAPPSGADNLGNHTATQTLVMGNFDISGVRQVIGGFGAMATSGTLDWNDVSNARAGSGYSLLYGSATNGPGPATYFHPFSFEYATKDGSGNLTQLAIPYGYSPHIESGLYVRGRYGGTWTTWRKILTENSSGNITVSGTLSATTLSGSGASLTALPAANLTGTLPAISGANLTSLNASNLASGTVPDARLTGNYSGLGTVTATSFVGSGASLTALNATNLASGTVPAARLPAYTGDVTKAAGGTALTIAAGAVDLTHMSATGTKNSTTFLRGDNTWAVPGGGSGGGIVSSQTFDASGTWTKPGSGEWVLVRCWGAGGGGGRGGSYGGAGGGGGAYVSGVYPLAELPSSVSVSVGVGGTGNSGGGDGTSGTASSFGAILTAQGGGYGNGINANCANSGNYNAGSGGSVGSIPGGDGVTGSEPGSALGNFVASGGSGGRGCSNGGANVGGSVAGGGTGGTVAGSGYRGGGGGASGGLGGGDGGAGNSGAGSAGVVPGGGGGGSRTGAAGNGANGRCKIITY